MGVVFLAVHFKETAEKLQNYGMQKMPL